MEITSFVLGMLTIIGVAVAILVVVGMVKISRQKEQITELWNAVNNCHSNTDQLFSTLEDQMTRNIDELRREYSSYVDSRVDKLQNKTNKEVLKG
jgi:predicted PurR-regulated permease PerM